MYQDGGMYEETKPGIKEPMAIPQPPSNYSSKGNKPTPRLNNI